MFHPYCFSSGLGTATHGLVHCSGTQRQQGSVWSPRLVLVSQLSDSSQFSIIHIQLILFIECNDMSTARKDVIAHASIIDPALCDGVVVKLITTQSTEQVCKTL